MTNNDILRRIRFALELNDAQMVAVFAQSEVTLSEADVVAYMAKEHEAHVKVCSGTLLAQFLDGLILEKRGPRKEGAPVAPPVEELTNNGVFKKLRIALSMQEKEVLAALAAGGQKLAIVLIVRAVVTSLSRHPIPIDRAGPGPCHLPKRTQGKVRADFGAGGAKETSSLPPRPRLLRSVARMHKWVHAVTAPTCSMPGDLMNIDARHHANRDGLIGDTIYGSGSGLRL